MKSSRSTGNRTSQRGAALLIFALILTIVLLSTFLGGLNSSSFKTSREQTTSDALTQAKEALIGKAVSERNNDLFGFLQLPDRGTSNNGVPDEGTASGNFSGNTRNISVTGRLPWRTLGLPPLKDANGECLWYAVSGTGKVSPTPGTLDVFNWDTLGHFEVFTSDGTSAGTVSSSGTNHHNRPLALVISAGPPLAGQNRAKSATDTVSDCGGNYDAKNYLDSYAADANINSIVNYFSGATNNATGDASAFATPKSIIAGDVEVLVAGNKVRIANDRLLTITTKEIFDRVKRYVAFKTDIESLIDDLSTYYLNNLSTASLPAATGNKGVDLLIANYLADPINTSLSAQKKAVLNNWKDNLLYTKPTTAATVDGTTDCTAVLLFSGERTASQSRASTTEKLDASNYLEAGNDVAFKNPGALGIYTTSGTGFTSAASSNDIARCIKGLPQISLANDLASFNIAGVGVTTNTSTPASPTVTIADDLAGSTGGCLWQPLAVPLAGKTLRAYYEFQFAYADTFALPLSTGSDRGNGFTFQMVRGDVTDAFGNRTPPSTCGTETTMGALGAADVWGSISYIIETDVRKNTASATSTNSRSDPAENHTAIMTNGNLNHTLSGTMSAACDGTASGCQHSPANIFEESPVPLSHKQRIEIKTGCNSTCSSCNPANHVAPNTYAKITTWVDCTDCNDTVTNFVGELIAAAENRDFSTTGNWTGSNWSIAAGALAHTAAADSVTLPNTALRNTPVAAFTYKVSASITTTTAGTLDVSFGGTSSGAIAYAAGTTTFSTPLKAISNAALTITPDALWVGSIDDVSITQTPTVQRCTILNTEMNSVNFGFTGGFLSTASTIQSVTLKNFVLRSD